MINYWWVTRPKRKLNSIPEVLSTFSELSLDQEWEGIRDMHLDLEVALERAGLKRVGERRDRTGGGARTYKAWLISLGLIFIQESTGQIKLTLSGEAIMAGQPPVSIIKNQVLKYQFPSNFSKSRAVSVSDRFKIRPFRFLLKLLSDERISKYLTEEEIAKIVIVEAENESDRVYENVVNRIIDFRNFGNSCLEDDFLIKYSSGKGVINLAFPYRHLTDTANTIVNWIEYTQLVKRNEDKHLVILDEKRQEVDEYLYNEIPFIDRPESHEYFQRKYGVDPLHTKDLRNLTATRTITFRTFAEQKIKHAFIAESLRRPISRITSDIVEIISTVTGIENNLVEESLNRFYPRGAISSFLSEYFELAFRGRDDAIEFEKATSELFRSVFGFRTEHVGQFGLTPDIVVYSDSEHFMGIIDNKAYSNYSITNDHKNRMIHNYIPRFIVGEYPLKFFSYIAGGFSKNINNQINAIYNQTGIKGSAISVSNVIKLVEMYEQLSLDHIDLKNLFSINKHVSSIDISNLRAGGYPNDLAMTHGQVAE